MLEIKILLGFKVALFCQPQYPTPPKRKKKKKEVLKQSTAYSFMPKSTWSRRKLRALIFLGSRRFDPRIKFYLFKIYWKGDATKTLQRAITPCMQLCSTNIGPTKLQSRNYSIFIHNKMRNILFVYSLHLSLLQSLNLRWGKQVFHLPHTARHYKYKTADLQSDFSFLPFSVR